MRAVALVVGVLFVGCSEAVLEDVDDDTSSPDALRLAGTFSHVETIGGYWTDSGEGPEAVTATFYLTRTQPWGAALQYTGGVEGCVSRPDVRGVREWVEPGDTADDLALILGDSAAVTWRTSSGYWDVQDHEWAVLPDVDTDAIGLAPTNVDGLTLSADELTPLARSVIPITPDMTGELPAMVARDGFEVTWPEADGRIIVRVVTLGEDGVALQDIACLVPEGDTRFVVTPEEVPSMHDVDLAIVLLGHVMQGVEDVAPGVGNATGSVAFVNGVVAFQDEG